jgi:putative flippase GtrA
MKISTRYQFLVWLLVGITTLAMDYLVFLVIYSISGSIISSNLASIVISSFYNFMFHRIFTFKTLGSFKEQALKYVLYQLTIWFVSTILIAFLHKLAVSISFAKILPLFLIAPVNFYVLKKWIYID